MAELAAHAYSHSFTGDGAPLIATARAGNVIGGGDFTPDRLLPDLIRALMASQSFALAKPDSVRPWQHVLEPLGGYLWLAARLLQEGRAFGGAWNFAPLELEGITTRAVVEKAVALWGEGIWQHDPAVRPQKETALLRLSREKAANQLGWRPVYGWEEALAATVSWFKQYQQRQGVGTDQVLLSMYDVCAAQIAAYTAAAQALRLPWTG